MMGRKDDFQSKLEFIDLNVLVPKNHTLRKINEKIDFSFIYNKMEKYYFKLGRKSLIQSYCLKCCLSVIFLILIRTRA